MSQSSNCQALSDREILKIKYRNTGESKTYREMDGMPELASVVDQELIILARSISACAVAQMEEMIAQCQRTKERKLSSTCHK